MAVRASTASAIPRCRPRPVCLTEMDAAQDLAAAMALLAEHQVAPEAERALILAVEAQLTTEQQNEMSELVEDGSGSNETDGPAK